MKRGDKIRGIIWALNTAVAGLTTVVVVATGYSDTHGGQIALVAIFGFIAIHTVLDKIEKWYLRKEQDEERRQRAHQRDAVPAIPWTAHRYTVDQQKDRYPGVYVEKVQKDA